MKAFTLIEIIIVMLVIGIIGITAAPKLLDIARDARIKNENSAVGNRRTGIDIVQLDNRTRNISPAYPAHIDSANTAPASISNPLFGNVLRVPITNAWEKTATDRYKGPTGSEYEYDPATGSFAMAAAGGGAGGVGGYYDFNGLNSQFNYGANPTVTAFSFPVPAWNLQMSVVRFSDSDEFGVVSTGGYLLRYKRDGTVVSTSKSGITAVGSPVIETPDGSALVIGSNSPGQLVKLDRDGHDSVFYNTGGSIRSVARMPNGNIAVFDNATNTISEISPGGNFIGNLYSNVVSGGGFKTSYMTFKPDNTVYIANEEHYTAPNGQIRNQNVIYKGTPGGSTTPFIIPTLMVDGGLTILPNGDLLVSTYQSGSNVIKRYDAETGAVKGDVASVTWPYGALSMSPNGKVYTLGVANRVRIQELSFPENQ